jgi:hypothetical protein
VDGFAHRKTHPNSITQHPTAPILSRNRTSIPPRKPLVLNGRKLPNTGGLPVYIRPPQSPAPRLWAEALGHRKTHPNCIEQHPKAPILKRNSTSIPPPKPLILNNRIPPNTGYWPAYFLRQPAPAQVWPELRSHFVLLTRFKFERNITPRANASRALRRRAPWQAPGLNQGWSSEWNRRTLECNA